MFNIFPFTIWSQFSPILTKHITSPLHTGIFTLDDANEKSFYLAEGSQGHYAMGNYVYFYWLIDPENGLIIDAKFQAFGAPILIGIGNFLCEKIIGKIYIEGKKFNFQTIKDNLNISEEILKTIQVRPYLNLCLDALDDIITQCENLFCNNSLSTPSTYNDGFLTDIGTSLKEEEWNNLSKEERLKLLRQAFSTHIESFLHLDGGGAVIESIDDNHTVLIHYSGNCSGCFSAIGSTLASIENIFQTYVFHKIKIKVNENSLNFDSFDK